jgi:ankyrin repeat protein
MRLLLKDGSALHQTNTAGALCVSQSQWLLQLSDIGPSRRQQAHVFNWCLPSSTPSGATPLHYAAHAGQLLMVTGLVMLGANSLAPDATGVTPWHLAAQYGQVCGPLLVQYHA